MSNEQIIDYHYNIGFAEELKEIEKIDLNLKFLPNCEPLPFKVQNNKIFLENVQTSTNDNLRLGHAEQVIVERKFEKYEEERDVLITGGKKRKRPRRMIERPNPRYDIEVNDEEDLMAILERGEIVEDRHTIPDEEPILINGRLRPIVPPEIPFNPFGDFGDLNIAEEPALNIGTLIGDFGDVNIPETEPALVNGTLIDVVPLNTDFNDIIIPTPLNYNRCKF